MDEIEYCVGPSPSHKTRALSPLKFVIRSFTTLPYLNFLSCLFLNFSCWYMGVVIAFTYCVLFYCINMYI